MGSSRRLPPRATCSKGGRCYDLVPELFGPDVNGHALVAGELDDPAALFAVEHAIRSCPERALSFGVQGSEGARAR